MKIPKEEYYYTYKVGNLNLGSNFANLETYAYADKFSDISGMWCSDDSFYLNKITINFKINEKNIEALTTTFAPAYQLTKYEKNKIHIDKIAFVPYECGYLRTVYQILLLHNSSLEDQTIDIHLRVRYTNFNLNINAVENEPACIISDKYFINNEERVKVKQKEEKFIIQNSSLPYARGLKGDINKVRILGSSITPKSHIFSKPNRSDIYYQIKLKGKSTLEIPIIYVVTRSGEEDARNAYEIAKEYEEIFMNSVENLKKRFRGNCDIKTPESLINRGVVWSKINMLRVQSKFPAGYSFGNSTPRDTVCVRDVYLYNMGNDYLIPEFSKNEIELLVKHARYSCGKFAEYIHAASEPVPKDDYDITINDVTPLFIKSIFHYYCLNQDDEFLDDLYPIVEKAAEYILSKIKDGLVFSEANGTSMYGVSGWRNLFPGGHINGYVTELNSECYTALRCAADLAEKFGNYEKAKKFTSNAELLKKEINQRLVSKNTGFYYLAIDQWGEKMEEISSDLIFPVMSEISPKEMTKHILELLFSKQFWTPFGCRTIGNEQPDYDPEYSCNLMGGIWPMVATWIAYSGRKLNKDKVLEALRNIYSISETKIPKNYGAICPGEFPERLNGDTYVSEGAKSSPVAAPSYLWLAIEGLVGIDPQIDKLVIEPCLPEEWKWLAVKNIPYKGEKITFFYWEDTIYSNNYFKTSYPLEVFDEEISESLNMPVFSIVLKRKEEIIVFLNACNDIKFNLEIEELPKIKTPIFLKAGEAKILNFNNTKSGI